MSVTFDQLLAVMPYAKVRIPTFIVPLNLTMARYEIDTRLRQAAFLAQIAHESGQLRYVLELASGEAYDTGRRARLLGNTEDDDDDGRLYKGRGLIQVTGTYNYRACSEHIFGDPQVLIAFPAILEKPDFACWSAGWFWDKHNLNELADAGNMRSITRRINGGYNGLEARLEYYHRALDALPEE